MYACVNKTRKPLGVTCLENSGAQRLLTQLSCRVEFLKLRFKDSAALAFLFTSVRDLWAAFGFVTNPLTGVSNLEIPLGRPFDCLFKFNLQGIDDTSLSQQVG